jgi:D-alanyl-D-alanine carboxypeptidase/D-alanyl-D-alanine-endopeptidase (penicillin-binding protein 4)
MRICIGILVLSLLSCSPLKKEFRTSEIIRDHFVGFALYDPLKKEFIYEYQADKYFTPASNTKILTMYSTLVTHGDSIPGICYIETSDTLYFWGTGDPSFLNPDVYQTGIVYDFLKSSTKVLAFSDQNFYDSYFGPGWGWDDYNDYYSVEKSPFPIYGNYLVVKNDSTTSGVTTEPDFFERFLFQDEPDTLRSPVIREQESNIIHIFRSDSTELNKILPFKTSLDLTVKLLEDTLNRPVYIRPIPKPDEAHTLYSTPIDSLLAPMMIFSDNFIAEQLLLSCSAVLSDSLSSEIVIGSIQSSDFSDLPDELNWVDGSGLSRYNLFTPRSVIRVWEKIDGVVETPRLEKLIATGGVNGTIRNLYSDSSPFIYGKTGSLRNNHSLSGFIYTDKGNRLIFSYMNSNYTLPSSVIKREMDKVLRMVKSEY